MQKRVSYAEPPHVFRIWAREISRKSRNQLGRAFASPKVARGAAYADILQRRRARRVCMTTNGGRAYLFHNEGGTNHSLRIKLVERSPTAMALAR